VLIAEQRSCALLPRALPAWQKVRRRRIQSTKRGGGVMRKEFDRSIPEIEQRLGMPSKISFGHKHTKTKGPGKKSGPDIAAIGRAKKKEKIRKKKVAMYWNGELEQYPTEDL
jgi:hypothetical protein